jgi:hypothetical protein
MGSSAPTLEMLNSEELGRIAVVVEGRPEIFPVNQVLLRRSSVIRPSLSGTWEIASNQNSPTVDIG